MPFMVASWRCSLAFLASLTTLARFTLFIVAFEPLLVILLLLDGGDPLGVGEVPLDRFMQAAPQGFPGLPTQLCLDLGDVDGIALVVSGPVGDKTQQGGVGNGG